MRRFTEAEIEKLRLMAECGHDGPTIARVLGRTPQAVRVKCVELGIRLRRPRADQEVRFEADFETVAGLRAAAAAKGTSVPRLARLLLETIVRDNLFDAIVDDQPRGQVRRERGTVAEIDVADSWMKQRRARAA